MVDFVDALRLLHPFLAVVVVFPLIGIVSYFAWQTRQRRLQLVGGQKSKIPPTSGVEHVNIGRRLAAGVIGLALIGIGRPLAAKVIESQLWSTNPAVLAFIACVFAATLISFVLLYRVEHPIWSPGLGLATAAGVLVLGFQDGVFRRDDQWYVSHFYIGITITLLMILSLVIVQKIYQDKTGRWRRAHVILNSTALLLLLVQGATGTRDLLEIPLAWQEPFVYKCDYAKKTCPAPATSSRIDPNP